MQGSPVISRCALILIPFLEHAQANRIDSSGDHRHRYWTDLFTKSGSADGGCYVETIGDSYAKAHLQLGPCEGPICRYDIRRWAARYADAEAARPARAERNQSDILCSR